MLFNQQQCFIDSTASFLSKLRAKKVEKLRNSHKTTSKQMTAYRKFRKWNIGFRNREWLFPVWPIVKKMSTDPRLFWHVTHIFFGLMAQCYLSNTKLKQAPINTYLTIFVYFLILKRKYIDLKENERKIDLKLALKYV